MSPKVTEGYKRQRRREIIDAADRVFARNGYNGTVMQDIIDEVGLSRGAVYAYFDNKEAVFRAVIEQQDDAIWQTLADLQSRSPLWPALLEHFRRTDYDSDGEADARRLIGRHIEYTAHNWTDAAEGKWIRTRYRRILSAYVDLIETAVTRGEFQPVLPVETIVRLLISVHDGISIGLMAAGTQTIDLSGQSTALDAVMKHLLRPAAPGED